MQELCDLQPFIEQSLDGTEPCKTCFFPAYPGINSLNLDAYKPMDFTEQWIYFHGDSTLRQVYGEFYGIIHKTQVAHPFRNGQEDRKPISRLQRQS